MNAPSLTKICQKCRRPVTHATMKTCKCGARQEKIDAVQREIKAAARMYQSLPNWMKRLG